MPRFLFWLVSAVLALRWSPCQATDVEHEFIVGLLLPFTSRTQALLAFLAAFDLDFRKNFEPDLIERLGPPIISIPNVHPSLRVRPIAGTTHSQGSYAIDTVLGWITGTVPDVIGIVGAQTSAISVPVASIAGVRKLPQISGGATSPVLSDKSQYPFFLRTISPDSVQGAAMWKWIQLFHVPSVAFVYTQEPYGQGLFQVVLDLAASNGRASRINGISASMPQEPQAQLEVARQACDGILSFGSKFVILGLSTVVETGLHILHIMEEKGMLYGSSSVQLLGSETLTAAGVSPYKPSDGLPVGVQKFLPSTAGRLLPNFEEMWYNLTTDDVYGNAATERYMLDQMLLPLSAADSPPVTDATFQESFLNDDILVWAPFIFDAAYTYIFAINELLHSGMPPSEIRGDVLLQALRQVTFEGVTGRIEFDQFGDRFGDWELHNTWPVPTAPDDPSTPTVWVHIGDFDSNSGILHTHLTPRWAPLGVNQSMPSEALFECTTGFEKDIANNLCVRCRPGIGCGYSPELGFPIGVAPPITDLLQEYLATVVAFDLDFRKNFEPEIRERFGPPVIDLGEIHPDLKIKLQIGTSDDSASVGLNTALDWFQGNGDFSRIAGLVFGLRSSVTLPVASSASAFEVPMIGFGATSPALSDKAQYRYFSRVVAPDLLQGRAMFAWMQSFQIPSAVFIYARDAYGEGLYFSTADAAADANSEQRLIAVSIRVVNDFDLDTETAMELEEAARRAYSSGTKFVIMGLDSPAFDSFMYILERQGMLYGPTSFQYFGSEAAVLFPSSTYRPSQGLPIGYQKLTPHTAGPHHQKFVELYTQLTLEDVYGPEAVSRYMLDYFRVPLEQSTSAFLTEASFSAEAMPDPSWFVSLLFDACYTFVVAINAMLHAGIDPHDIHGERLLEEVRRTSFDSAGGTVSFNDDGDQLGRYELWNWVPANDSDLDKVLEEGVNIESRVAVVGLTDASASSFSLYGNTSVLVWAGGVTSSMATTRLFECPPGWAWEEVIGRCSVCPTGTFSTGGVRIACQACPPGSTSSEESEATSCKDCPAGFFKEAAENNCTECPPGRFGEQAGGTACTDCEVGKYNADSGQLSCLQCGAGRASESSFTTMERVVVDGVIQYYNVKEGATSNASCGCRPGYREDPYAECIGCSKGMFCPGLDDVQILGGYYSPADSLDIFKCHGDEERCKGGPWPGDVCAEGRHGSTCSLCLDNMSPTGDGGCEPCQDIQKAPFFIAMLVLVLALILLYYVAFKNTTNKGGRRSLSVVLCGIALGQLLTAMQQMSVVASLSVEWEDPFKSFLELVRIFIFDIDILHLNCVTSLRPMQTYFFKLSCFFASVLIMLCIHIVHVSVWLNANFRKHRWSCMAAISTLLMVFYITIASIVLEPWQCRENPNRKWTVWNYQGVLCFESGEHIAMMIVALLVFLLVPVGFLAVVMYIVHAFPVRLQAGDTKFVQAFSFLFFRFRSKRYGFVIVHMLKSLLLALCLVVPDVVMAIFFIIVGLQVGFAATLLLLPWRVRLANVVDGTLGISMLLVVFISSVFVGDKDVEAIGLSWLCLVLMLAGLFFIIGVALYALWDRFLRSRKEFEFFLCHHKAGSGAYTRLLKMYLIRQTSEDVFIDSDNLENLDHLLDHVKNDTRTFVVVSTADIYSRPWCLGEMTTARLCSLNTLLLALPDCQDPSEAFIADLLDNGHAQLQVLFEVGIDLEMLEETLRWVPEVRRLEVPGAVNHSIMQRLVNMMRSRQVVVEKSARVQATPSHMTTGSGVGKRSCFIMYDFNNFEASATSLILQKMLAPIMSAASAGLLPEVVESEDGMPDSPSCLLVICMNGTFESAIFLRMLLQTAEVDSALCPVFAEATFRVPPKDDIMPRLMASTVEVMDEVQLNFLAGRILGLFKEIATTFQPHHAPMSVLKVNVQDIARRIRHLKVSKDTSPQGGTRHSPGTFGGSPGLSSVTQSGSKLSSIKATSSWDMQASKQGSSRFGVSGVASSSSQRAIVSGVASSSSQRAIGMTGDNRETPQQALHSPRPLGLLGAMEDSRVAEVDAEGTMSGASGEYSVADNIVIFTSVLTDGPAESSRYVSIEI